MRIAGTILINECRICQSSDLVEVMNLGDSALTGVFPKEKSSRVQTLPLELVWCRNCSLLQLGINPDPAEMYGDNYGYRSGLNKSMVDHLRRKAEWLQNQVRLDEGDTVLDIGSNDGTFLSFFVGKGAHLVGVDPTAKKFLRYYPSEVDVYPEFFDQAFLDSSGVRNIKLVTSIAMFYDLENPKKFVELIAGSLAREGLWHFEQSYLPSMLESNSYDTICHEHLEYYSLSVVKRLLESCGLVIVDVSLNDVNGGSFAVTAALRESSFKVNSELIEKVLMREVDLGLDDPEVYLEFADRAKRLRSELLSLLNQIKGEGKSIIGYGASTKGNVLLQYCGIGPDALPLIVDVNEEKHGSFTPGSGIQITSEHAIGYSQPDYMLVLPWHFRDFIIEKEKDYLNRGGKLVFPFPEVEIVEVAPST